MCGISGIVSKHRVERVALQQMTDLLSRRGPDDFGVFSEGNVGLGHRRLSIIDLSSGHQPMFNDDRSVVIVFNGEIYNFLELKSQLVSRGTTFSTTSDTEVIVKGYEVYGIKGILERLEGMFAFALYDLNTKTVYLARDRFGEKPLYYFSDDAGFYFASELKALKPVLRAPEIDKIGLNLYLSLSYIPAPYTILKNVKKLQPGCLIQIQPDGIAQEINYYSLTEKIEGATRYENYDEAQRDLRDLLFDSVRKRMIADVPLGAFLSGGIDSSIVSAIMARESQKPVSTFSIGFREKSYDESERAALVARHIKSNHTLHVVGHEDLLEIADDVIRYFDEPFGDSSALPSFMVAKKAREKVTVVLTGDCADELFGGYEKYLAPYYAGRFNALPGNVRALIRNAVGVIPHSPMTNHFLRKAKKVIANSEKNAFDLHYSLMCLGFSNDELHGLLNPLFVAPTKEVISQRYQATAQLDFMDRGFFTDVTTVLEGDMLAKVDRMCMLNSLEGRVPFLDSKIVEASFRMPASFKILGTNKKRILKDTFRDLLPPEVFKFSKKGFGVPIALWFRNELKTDLRNELSKTNIEAGAIFNYATVDKLLREHQSGAENHSSKLWALYVFQKWHKSFF